MIRIRRLRKAYGRELVLDGVDLSVESGERVALLGPNGAGKTTLFRCVLGIVPFRGELRVDGLGVRDHGKEARRRIGYVPQSAPPFDLTLARFLDLVSALHGADPSRAAGRLRELGLRLEEHGEKPLRALSGGMRQKALLALALGVETPLLLLDEPTASLDPRSRHEFLHAVRGVDQDRTLLFASHRYDEIETLADRVVVLHRGRLAFDGTPTELRDAADLSTRLWLRVGREDAERVAATLRDDDAVRSVRLNGAGVLVEVPPARELDVLASVRQRRLPVAEFRTRPPEPEEILDRVLARVGGEPPEIEAAAAGAGETAPAGRGAGGRTQEDGS